MRISLCSKQKTEKIKFGGKKDCRIWPAMAGTAVFLWWIVCNQAELLQLFSVLYNWGWLCRQNLVTINLLRQSRNAGRFI